MLVVVGNVVVAGGVVLVGDVFVYMLVFNFIIFVVLVDIIFVEGKVYVTHFVVVVGIIITTLDAMVVVAREVGVSGGLEGVAARWVVVCVHLGIPPLSLLPALASLLIDIGWGVGCTFNVRDKVVDVVVVEAGVAGAVEVAGVVGAILMSPLLLPQLAMSHAFVLAQVVS